MICWTLPNKSNAKINGTIVNILRIIVKLKISFAKVVFAKTLQVNPILTDAQIQIYTGFPPPNKTYKAGIMALEVLKWPKQLSNFEI